MTRALPLDAGTSPLRSLPPPTQLTHKPTDAPPGHLAASKPYTATAATTPRRRRPRGCDQHTVRTSQRAASKTHVPVQPKASRP
jgi:hypothetical protein